MRGDIEAVAAGCAGFPAGGPVLGAALSAGCFVCSHLANREDTGELLQRSAGLGGCCRTCLPRARAPTRMARPAPPPAGHPRTLEMRTRLYSPCALGSCLEFT